MGRLGRLGRLAQAASLLVLLGCASQSSPDRVDRARHTLEGFQDASPWVEEALDGAAAWAVFSGVVDGDHDCGHDGILFRADGSTTPVHLQCHDRPVAPAGIAYHQLVLLRDPADLARLAAGPLDLEDAAQHSTTDPAPHPTAPRLLITTSRASILFEHRRLRQVLELRDVRDAPPPPPRTP